MSQETSKTPIPGSPAWWSSQPQRVDKAGARGRPSVSFDKIIATALDAVDEAGPQAFNMRMLAERLESGTATLYRHFRSKDEILAYVVDHVLGELDVAPAAVAAMPWRQGSVAAAQAFYRVLNRHPRVVPLLVAQIPVGANGLRYRECWLALFLANGFSAQLAASAYVTIAHYVVGFAIQQHAAADAAAGAGADGSLPSHIDPAAYPATTKAGVHLAGMSVDEEFYFGLTLILDGLALLAPPHAG